VCKDNAVLPEISADKNTVMMIQYCEKSNKIPLVKLKYALTYFNAPYGKPKVDVIREWQYAKPRGFFSEFYTLFTNLAETEENIFSHFEKNTKYEINRAKNKDAVIIKTENSFEIKDAFYRFYNEFAQSKSLLPINEKETDLLIQNDMLVIRSGNVDGKPLVFHTYITAQERARLLHSASLFRVTDDSAERNLTGRVNRLLHWDDICYFKNRGFSIYDWGGISMDKYDTQRQAINQFKEAFGGIVVKEYKSFIPASIKGYVYLTLKKMAGKLSI
jgi:hypothetical protein